MSTLEAFKDRPWRLLTFRQAMVTLSVALLLCALISGAYQSRVYFCFAASVGGVLLIARAWFSYCKWKDGRAYDRGRIQVPYSLRGTQSVRVRKPAFLMNSADFDDDLTRFTVAAEEDFSNEQCWRAKIVSSLLSGALMILFSFVL